MESDEGEEGEGQTGTKRVTFFEPGEVSLRKVEYLQ